MIISRTYGPPRCHNFDSAGYVGVGRTGVLDLASPDCRQGMSCGHIGMMNRSAP
jgi:hypothetical protein